jgi:hypothetical protein
MKLALLALAVAAAATPHVVGDGTISTPLNDYNWTQTRDGKIAVFARSEADFRNARVFLARKGEAPVAVDLGAPGASDTDPQIAADGRSLLFVSDRPLEPGRKDLNIWRATKIGSAWRAEPVVGVNSPGVELGPELHGGALWFNTTRKGGPGRLDLWRAAPKAGGFADPEPLPAPVNSPASEGDVTLSRDGRVMLFWSDRPGGLGAGDIWMSVKVGDGWAEPENLGPTVNSPGFDFGPHLSGDEKTLYFGSMRPRGGNDQMSDIYSVPVRAVPRLAATLAGK